MKISSLVGLICFLNAPFCQSQLYTAEDGTSVQVSIVNNSAEGIQRITSFIGFHLEGPEMASVRNLGLGYFSSKYGSANITFGAESFGWDLNYFAFSKYKNTHISNSLKFENGIRYVGRIPIESKLSVAPHFAGNFTKDFNYDFYQILPGISLVKTKHARLTADEVKRRGATLVRLNLDAVITRPNEPLDDEKQYISYYSLIHHGARAYIDGRIGFWGTHGNCSFNYMIGYSFYKTSDWRDKLNNLERGKFYGSALVAIGFGFNFF